MPMTSRSLLLCALAFAAPLAAVACSDGTPTANPPPQPTGSGESTAAPETTAAPATSTTAAPEATATATASATATSAPTADKPKSSGRPPVLLADPKSITDTIGSSPGAKMELGEKDIATLRIPEGSFTQGTNVTFAIDAKCKTTGLVSGKLYKITPVVPPSTSPKAVPSNNGTPFVLVLPNSKKKDFNLAIGNYETDAKGNETMKWKIVAPTKSDDTTSQFELDTLPDGCLHLTNKAPN